MNFSDSKNKIRLLKQQIMLFLLMMLAFPVSAQENADTVFTFKFYTGKNEFYSPGLDNGPELKRMFECVDRFKDLLSDRKAILYVNGYSSSPKKTTAQNLAIAKTRSNRVKSELITLKGLKEDNFITRNHAGQGNFVTVRFNIPKEFIQEPPQETTSPAPLPSPQEEQAEEIIEIEECATDSVPTQQTAATSKIKQDSNFALKTNLLDYAILMPNVEVEWMCADRWSVALEGQMAWYSKTPPHKVYRIATVIPEARFWPIKKSKWHGLYVGLFAGAGLYDLCNGKKGHEGEGFMGGLSVGYMWPISKHMSLEAGIGAGYLRTRDKVYLPFEGHYLYQLTKNINYFGPLRLKLSLVWRIPK